MPRDVFVLTLIAFLVAVGFGVMVPVLPVFARSFHVSGFMVGADPSQSRAGDRVSVSIAAAVRADAVSSQLRDGHCEGQGQASR